MSDVSGMKACEVEPFLCHPRLVRRGRREAKWSAAGSILTVQSVSAFNHSCIRCLAEWKQSSRSDTLCHDLKCDMGRLFIEASAAGAMVHNALGITLLLCWTNTPRGCPCPYPCPSSCTPRTVPSLSAGPAGESWRETCHSQPRERPYAIRPVVHADTDGTIAWPSGLSWAHKHQPRITRSLGSSLEALTAPEPAATHKPCQAASSNPPNVPTAPRCQLATPALSTSLLPAAAATLPARRPSCGRAS